MWDGIAADKKRCDPHQNDRGGPFGGETWRNRRTPAPSGTLAVRAEVAFNPTPGTLRQWPSRGCHAEVCVQPSGGQFDRLHVDFSGVAA